MFSGKNEDLNGLVAFMTVDGNVFLILTVDGYILELLAVDGYYSQSRSSVPPKILLIN